MPWALIIQGLILAYGLVAARKVRSVRAALALGAGPVGLLASIAAVALLEFPIGEVVAAALCAAAAVAGGTTAHQHYVEADDTRDDLTRREHLETVAGALTASAVYDGIVALVCLLLGWLLSQ